MSGIPHGVDGVPGRRRDSEVRKAWLRQHGVDSLLIEQVVEMTDADMVEEVLADRHRMSRSKLHKKLAKANQLISSEMKARRKSKR